MDNTKKLSRKKQVFYLSIGRLITVTTMLLISISLSRLLSIEEYANYRQTILVFSFLTPFLTLGFDRAVYYNFEKNKENHGEQILNAQYAMISVALLFSLFFILGGAGLISKLFKNPHIEMAIILYSIYTIFNAPVLLLQPVLVINQKVKLLSIFNIFNKLTSLIVIVIVAYFFKNATSVIIALLFTGIISFVIVEILLLKNTSKISNKKLNKDILNNYKMIGFPLLAASIMGIAGKNIDKFLISIMMTPKDLAIYANGAIEIPLIGAITGAIMVVILSDFTKLLNNGKIKETFQLWNKAVEMTSSILIPLMYILLLNADWLIVALYGEKYIDSAKPFKIYLFLLPMRTMIFSSVITASGKTKIITKGALIFLISNMILSIMFIKIFSFVGPAIATVISAYLSGFYLSYRINNLYNVGFFKIFALPKMSLYLLIGFLSYILSNFFLDNFNTIAIKNIIFVAIYITVITLIGKEKIYLNLLNILKKL